MLSVTSSSLNSLKNAFLEKNQNHQGRQKEEKNQFSVTTKIKSRVGYFVPNHKETSTIFSKVLLRTGGRLAIANQTRQTEVLFGFTGLTASDIKMKNICRTFIFKQEKSGNSKSQITDFSFEKASIKFKDSFEILLTSLRNLARGIEQTPFPIFFSTSRNSLTVVQAVVKSLLHFEAWTIGKNERLSNQLIVTGFKVRSSTILYDKVGSQKENRHRHVGRRANGGEGRFVNSDLA